MTTIKERYRELQRHEAAVAIAYHCERLEWDHPISQMIREGRNDEALSMIDELDLQRAFSETAWRELTSASKDALRSLLIEFQDEWEFDTCVTFFSEDTLQEFWDLEGRLTQVFIYWLERVST